MQNAGHFALCAETVTTARTAAVVTSASGASGALQAYIDRLDGILAALIEFRFTYGSGGTSGYAIVETSLDGGTSWIEVARFDFTTASKTRIVNLSALTPRTALYDPAALSADSAIDGVLGPLWRCRLTSVGTYAGSTLLAVRLHAR